MLRPQWLTEIEEELQRPLRVLHLGNVANNAYLNAKIMRRIGIEADAVSYDYYHVMGTPEWEDCDFSGKYGDAFFPDWWRVNLKNFERPYWFFQGRKDLCRQAILNYRDQDKNARNYHDMLNFDVQYICYRNSPFFRRKNTLLTLPGYLWRRLQFYIFSFGFLLRKPKPAWMFLGLRKPSLTHGITLLGRILSFPFVAAGFLGSAAWLFIKSIFSSSDSFGSNKVIASKRRKSVNKTLRKARRIAFEMKYLRPLSHDLQVIGSKWFTKATGKKFSDVFGRSFGEMILPTLRREWQERRELERARSQDATLAELNDVIDLDDENISDASPRIIRDAKYLKALIKLYDTLTKSELKNLTHVHSELHPNTSQADIGHDVGLAFALGDGWKDVLEYYDIVQCYAVDCIIPMACGLEHFVAYEHGTLRSIPFQDTQVGRLAKTGYTQSSKVMVTNLDNLAKCDLMELTDEQVICLPHAMDDIKLLSFQDAHKHIKPDNTKPPLFLSPSRQDWVDGDMNYTKGNDHFLRAIKIMHDEGFDMQIVLVEWGRHLAESKALIEELGIGHMIKWVAPMKKADLWKAYFSAHAIVDQFTIPAFGSVTFEALTFGKRVISRIDTQLATRFFSECPPMLTCSTPETVANAMRLVLTDPEDIHGLGEATREWARQYHSTQTILDLQLDAYRPLINDGMKNRKNKKLAEYNSKAYKKFGLNSSVESILKELRMTSRE